tara:strand:- start:1611 stop:2183 length:573 start_codon:yes stop_codon:yes gene_type:complete
MDYSALTKEEKQSIFEVVNNDHLRLKGNQKKLLKSQFCNSWKINKNIGAFELFMKLYESEELYDIKNEWFKKYIEDYGFSPEHYKSQKPVPLIRHLRRVRHADEQVVELEQKLEEIKEGKGYISQEEHEYELNKVKQEQLEIIRERGDTIANLRNTENALRQKLKGADRLYHEMKDNYEKIIAQMSKTES